MGRFRPLAALGVATSLVLGLVVAGAVPASADGTTAVGVTCNIPIVGTKSSTVDVTANDSADPVNVGAAVTNTIVVPVPSIDDLPFDVTITEVKLTMPIPANVTVNSVTFTSSSFSSQTWAVNGGNLIITLSGSVLIGPGRPVPTAPQLSVATTIGGAPRTVQWKVPSSIAAKANVPLVGASTVPCTPNDPNQVLISTTVQDQPTNLPPTATDQAVTTPYGKAKAITLSGTDPESSPLSFAVGTGPAHGTLSGTAPNLTYTPAAGYSGPDSFTFTASDGSLSDSGTVNITVSANLSPTATDQNLATNVGQALPVTLTGTDPEGAALSFAVGTGPAHGTLSGTAPNLTYTPAAGYSGADSFTFTASDGSLSDSGTVGITVTATAPAAPTGVTAVARAGAAQVGWTAPTSTGGSPITGYRVTSIRAGVAQTPVVFTSTATTQVIEGLTNGQAHTFRVAAVNAVGTGPDSTASAAVTPQGWLPFASWTAAVDRLHQWMLGRVATTQERALWVGRFQAGTHGLPDLVVALRAHTLHTTSIDPVVRLYQAFFLRVPDRAGILYWVERRLAGLTLAKTADGFARSPEFTTLYGSLNNQQFVEKVYQNVLGRPGEPAGVAFWTGELNAGRRTRGSLMIGFSESPEYKTTQAANVNAGVFVIYIEGRTPTAAQREAIAARLRGGTALAVIAREILRAPATVTRATAP